MMKHYEHRHTFLNAAAESDVTSLTMLRGVHTKRGYEMTGSPMSDNQQAGVERP